MASSIYTLADIDAAVLSRLENNDVFFQTAERYSIINEALRCTNLLSGFYQGTVQLISQAGQLVYDVPAGMVYPQRCAFEGIQLDPIPITRIGQDYRTWATDNSRKNGPVARWIPIGMKKFCIHPADSFGGGRIDVTGVLNVPLLVDPTDTMVLEDQFVTIVVEYCAQRLPLKCGGTPFVQASQLYTRSFQPALRPLLSFQKFRFPRYFVQHGSPTTEGRSA